MTRPDERNTEIVDRPLKTYVALIGVQLRSLESINDDNCVANHRRIF
jgi:hypothetical protein